MKPLDLRIVKTKEALKEALMLLLKEKALNAISVTEICRLAKVNRGTFYTHYGQVEDLFEEYYREIMQNLKDSYLEPYKYAWTIHTKELNPATIRIFHHIEKYEEFYRIVFSNTAPLAYYYLLFDHLQQLLDEDLRIHGNDQIDIAMLSAYQANAILGLVVEWHRQDFKQGAEEMNKLLVELLKYVIGD